MPKKDGRNTVVIAACFAATPGASLLAPFSALPALPLGAQRGGPLPPTPPPTSLPDLLGQAPQTRLSIVDWNAYDERDTDGPGTYSFGYEIEDPATGNTQFRQEERFANGTVVGSYGLVEPDGNVRVVSYVADAMGYRVRVENSLRKSEDTPARTPAGAGKPRRPESSPSDRIFGSAQPAVVETFPVHQHQQRQQQQNTVEQQRLEQLPPLQWAVQSLQDGRRTPLHEQRLRPASAEAGVVRRNPPSLNGQYLLTQRQPQQYQQQQQQYQQQQQQQYHQQQQQQLYDRGAYVQKQYGLAPLATQYEDVSNSLAPGANWYGSYGRDSGSHNRRADGADSWSSAPIVVWPGSGHAPGSPAVQASPAVRPQLPADPLLDKLIYQ